jgi:hypothetical protein
MEPQDTYRKHPFELVIHTKELSVEEMLGLAECLDSFEISEKVRDYLVVDVLEVDPDHAVVVVTPREALTYDMMKQLVEALVGRVRGRIGKKFVRVGSIRWRVERAGISSDRHSQQFL